LKTLCIGGNWGHLDGSMKHFLLAALSLVGLTGCATDGQDNVVNPPPGVGAYGAPPPTNPVQQGSGI